MTDDIDRLFQQIRGNKFLGGQDPHTSIHEQPPGPGNPQASGWYRGHPFSSFVGQGNVLLDPTFETIPGPGVGLAVTPATTKTRIGHWAAHYVLNSGTVPATRPMYLISRRGEPAQAPFSSGVFSWDPTFLQAEAPVNIDFYLYPNEDYSPTYIPTLDHLVASVRTWNPGGAFISALAFDAVTLRVEILADGVLVANSDDYDFLGAAELEHKLIYTTYGPISNAVAYRWRVKIHVARAAAAPTAGWDMYLGEPSLHMNFHPEPLPFHPPISNWFPSDVRWGLYLSGDHTPAQIAANQNNYEPTDLNVISKLLLQTDATPRTLTGIKRGRDGQILVLHMDDTATNSLTLAHDSASSSAGNKIKTPNDTAITLLQNETAVLQYDDQQTCWKVIAVAKAPVAAFDGNLTGTVHLTGVISPSALTGNTDNWNPTGLSTANVIRLSATGSINLTGIVAQSTGRVILLENVGSNEISLPSDVTSTAANRFLNGRALTLPGNTSLLIRYDGTSARWRVIG